MTSFRPEIHIEVEAKAPTPSQEKRPHIHIFPPRGGKKRFFLLRIEQRVILIQSGFISALFLFFSLYLIASHRLQIQIGLYMFINYEYWGGLGCFLDKFDKMHFGRNFDFRVKHKKKQQLSSRNARIDSQPSELFRGHTLHMIYDNWKVSV